MYYPDERRRSVDRLATELYTARRSFLLGVARRHASCEDDAEEALQEAFAEFLAGYDPSGGAPPLPWLVTVTKRACWRAKEKRGVCLEPATLAGMVVGDVPDQAARVAGRDEARRRLGALKRDERRALVLHAAGFTYPEIGERSGWTHTKVNRCLYEGRKALRASG
ncbi:MAG TPA: RNA polymerase sigma factor [Solirubrobacterales bacterium]|jgi:DNA-directed RNA polymerase specialized sigma24 family protein|nr:RNA polymerase sigma factor [Solirubrobacterales bacterium]